MSDERSEGPGAADSAALGARNEGARASELHPADAEAQHDGLLSRLALIEDQPLESRAEAYAHVHDELRAALDAADRQGGR